MMKILKNKLYMMLFVSDMISDFGDTLYYLALMNYVLLIPETQIAMSLITLSETLPILTVLFMGITADKTKNKVNMIVYTLLFRMGLYSIIGFAMGFTPALWIVLVAISLNLLSDLAGQFESYLYMPISLKIVNSDDREASFAFRQSIGSILRIIFQSSGAILITVMSYQQLAFFNAFTFFVSLCIFLSVFKPLKQLLNGQVVQKQQENEGKEPWWKMIVSVVHEARRIPKLMATLPVIICINAVMSMLGTIFVLSLKYSSTLAIISNEVSIAGLSITILSGSILGSFLVTSVFKNIDMTIIIRITVFIIPVVYMSLLINNGYLFFISVLSLGLLGGVVNPKLSAMIFNTISEDKLATFSAGLNLLCHSGIIGMQVLMSSLIVILPITTIVWILFVSSLLLMVYTILQGCKSRRV